MIRAAYERHLVATGVVGSKALHRTARPREALLRQGQRIAGAAARIMAGDRRRLMVLCEDPNPGEGWFEAHVVEKVGPDLFRLTYRDFPEKGVQTRQRNQLALLPPITNNSQTTA